MIGRYQTTTAFRAALEERLKQTTHAQHTDLMRLRRQVAFDRLLARLFSAPNAPWLLKGGYAFELRLGGKARATKDLDLTIPDPRRLKADTEESSGTDDDVLDRLQDAAAIILGDGFDFRVGARMADLDAAPYGGARYPVEARLDSRTFATFHVDVGVGDAIAAPPEWLAGPDLLGFAGIAPARAAAISREQQFAEKLHAYTLPRNERSNTRVKDLVDQVLLIELGLPDAEQVRYVLRVTFERRGTHQIPRALDAPPEAWAAPYAILASECGLEFAEINVAFAFLADYWRALWERVAP
jgi:hypothetical protein